MSDNNTSSGGVGFTGLLLVAFIVLKLTGVIDWSWWWVLSPAWIGVLLTVIAVALYAWVKVSERDKIVNRYGEIKSKWQERLEQVQEARRKADELRNQTALDGLIKGEQRREGL
jgi:O-antigen ligase